MDEEVESGETDCTDTGRVILLVRNLVRRRGG